VKKRKLPEITAILALLSPLLCAPRRVTASETYWICDPDALGDWSAPANWDGDVPSSGDVAYIANGGAAAISQGTAAALAVNAGSTSAVGHIVQSSGTCHVEGSLTILGPAYTGSDASFLLSAGQLTTGATRVGNYWAHVDRLSGVFQQTGGDHVAGGITVEGVYSGPVHYGLQGGTVSAGHISLRNGGTFTQSGGTCTASTVWITAHTRRGASYALTDGELQAEEVVLANADPAAYAQSGGTATIDMIRADSYGVFTFSGGTARINKVAIGGSYSGGNAKLVIHSSGPDVSITELLQFGKYGRASVGGTLHMEGASFDTARYGDWVCCGLTNCTFLFEGGAERPSTFEAAAPSDAHGQPRAYRVKGLVLGGKDVGLVKLVNARDNGHRDSAGREHVFAQSLTIHDGSRLDLGGLRIYVEGDVEDVLDGYVAACNTHKLFDSTLPEGDHLDAVYDPDENWTVVVPEPLSLSLVAIGGIGLACRKPRRRCPLRGGSLS